MRRVGPAAVLAGAAALVAAAPAAAHGLVGKQELPIPRWLFAWAAAIVLVVSFVALALLWREPRIEQARERLVLRVPRVFEVVAGLIGVALFAIVVYAGLRGLQNPQANLAPTAIFVIFWVGIPFLSVLAGDVFAAFNPWRAIGRASGWVAGRLGSAVEPLPYPSRLGRWPAALGIFAFAWVELAYSGREDPSTLAVLALVYAGVQLVGMSLYGERAWSANADAFGVYFGLFARLAPLRWRDGRLALRWPATAIAGLTAVPGTTALVLVSIGTTSFDGFSQGALWADAARWLIDRFGELGLGGQRPIEAAFTVGLLAVVGAVAAFYRLGVTGMHGVDRSHSTGELSRAFAHTLVPIAFAYVFAHYLSLLAYQGQALGYLASDPLGRGSDLLGTAGATIDYTWISATGIWYVQVGALVLGHVTALILAHERALRLFPDGALATRSQYWMLAVMVGFTSLALWLLSAANSS